MDKISNYFIRWQFYINDVGNLGILDAILTRLAND